MFKQSHSVVVQNPRYLNIPFSTSMFDFFVQKIRDTIFMMESTSACLEVLVALSGVGTSSEVVALVPSLLTFSFLNIK